MFLHVPTRGLGDTCYSDGEPYDCTPVSGDPGVEDAGTTSSGGSGSDNASICASQGGVWANNTCTSTSATGGGLVDTSAPKDANTCAAGGGTWNGVACTGYLGTSTAGVPPTGSFLTSFLNSLAASSGGIVSAITGRPISASTPTACASANGVWNPTTNLCSPSSGVSSYLPLLLVAGGVLLVVMSKKGR